MKTKAKRQRHARRASEPQSLRAEQLALFPDYQLPVEGRRARNEFTVARLRAKRRWENYKRCLVRNPDLSFPEFLKSAEFADLRS